MVNVKKVLLFNVGLMKEGQIYNVCKNLNIIPVRVNVEQYSECLGYLAGIKGIKSNGKVYKGMAFPKEMLVFSGINSEELDIFLQKYNDAGIEKINLKAVLTPFNINWTGEMLYKELLKEHSEMAEKI